MSYHILHLLSHHLRVRLHLDQLLIENRESGVKSTVPVSDVAAIIAAAPDLVLTAGALRRLAELNVVLLVCNDKFEPCCLTLPYYRATNTELLRRQIEWTRAWKQALWRRIITAKIRNQALVLRHLKRAHGLLVEIANRCENGAAPLCAAPESLGTDVSLPPDSPAAPSSISPVNKPSLASVTRSHRGGLHLSTPEACESRAARHYWKYLLPRLSGRQQTTETRRIPGTRAGVNGMLDYGYAIMRSAVLRSLAVHGFIAAIGIAHTPKASAFALADDLMEPLRPWIDRELGLFAQAGPRPMEEWMHQAVNILTFEVTMGKSRVRLLHAIDLYVQSFADAALLRTNPPLRIPMLPDS